MSFSVFNDFYPSLYCLTVQKHGLQTSSSLFPLLSPAIFSSPMFEQILVEEKGNELMHSTAEVSRIQHSRF